MSNTTALDVEEIMVPACKDCGYPRPSGHLHLCGYQNEWVNVLARNIPFERVPEALGFPCRATKPRGLLSFLARKQPCAYPHCECHAPPQPGAAQ